ncbi:hypothetical protein KSP39_PZI001310 [Platanthera zijinensis]|uniref:Retroviral polymerase SH3-like domain-containing protein n=1 Tax=Platanthera zijinensis TaxID=2320716 RepID=A0AAP0C4H0_9ASPA
MTCFVHHPRPPVDKLAPRFTKYIFVGYSRTQKCYVCHSSTTGKTITSADVTFFKDQSFYSTSPEAISLTDLPRPIVPTHTSPPSIPIPNHMSPLPPLLPTPPPLQVYTRHRPLTDALRQLSAADAAPRPDDPPMVPSQVTVASTTHPLSNYVSLHRLSSPFRRFAASLSSISTPFSVREALQHPGWRATMDEEMIALKANHTWDLAPSWSFSGCCK